MAGSKYIAKRYKDIIVIFSGNSEQSRFWELEILPHRPPAPDNCREILLAENAREVGVMAEVPSPIFGDNVLASMKDFMEMRENLICTYEKKRNLSRGERVQIVKQQDLAGVAIYYVKDNEIWYAFAACAYAYRTTSLSPPKGGWESLLNSDELGELKVIRDRRIKLEDTLLSRHAKQDAIESKKTRAAYFARMKKEFPNAPIDEKVKAGYMCTSLIRL